MGGHCPGKPAECPVQVLHPTVFLSGFRACMMRATTTVAEIKFEIARQVDLNNLHAKRLYSDVAAGQAEKVKAIAYVDGARWVSLKERDGSDL